MTYYAHYGQIAFMPYASDNVVVDNIRKMAELGVKGNFFEFYPYNSGFNWNYQNFGDLNLYLFYRFAKNPKLDYEKEVTDFMEHVYGPAAKLAKQYHDNLMKVSAMDNKYGIRLSASNYNKELSYLSPENLYKWSMTFDEMEKVTAESSTQMKLNLDNLRRAVDMAVYGRWPECSKKYPDYFKDPEIVCKRIGPAQHKMFGKAAEEFLFRAEMAIKFMGAEKPLPAQFAKTDPSKILRLIPNNKANCPSMSKVPKIVEDNDAAFGYGATIDRPDDNPLHFGYFIFGKKESLQTVTLEEWDITPGKYQLFHLGEVQPTGGECLIWFSSKSWSTNLDLSQIFDLTAVDAKYDAWVSLKFPEGYRHGIDEIVLCDQIILERK